MGEISRHCLDCKTDWTPDPYSKKNPMVGSGVKKEEDSPEDWQAKVAAGKTPNCWSCGEEGRKGGLPLG